MPRVTATFIKVGGSVITVKDAPEPTLRGSVISDLVREVAEVYSEGEPLILANGAGSFGHPLAKRAGLDRGLQEGKELPSALTAQSALRLNFVIVEGLLKQGVPAISFSPRSYVYGTDSGWDGEITPMRMAIERGFLPVTFGDVVMHQTRGAAIFSADDAPIVLAPLIRRVVFLVDVPGVLGPDGEVLETAGPDVLEYAGGSGRADVTGGMAEKLRKGFRLASSGIEVRVAGYASAGDLRRALAGEAGTLLLAGR